MNSTSETAHQELRYLLHVLFKHKVKFLTVLTIIIAGMLIWSFIVPWTYEANTKILVTLASHDVGAPASIQAQKGSVRGATDTNQAQPINSTIGHLKGSVLIAQTIADVGVNKMYPNITEQFKSDTTALAADRATPLFQKSLTVEATRQPDVFIVSFKHDNPDIASQAINRLLELFIERHAPVVQVSSNKPSDADIPGQNTAIVPLVLPDTIAAGSWNEQKELLQKQISEVEKNLEQTRGEILVNENKIRSIKAYQPGSDIPLQIVQEKGLNTDAMNIIRTKLVRLRERERELRKKYTERNAQVVSVREEIDETQRLLAKEEKTYLDNTLLSIADTQKKLKAKEVNLKRNMARHQQELVKINDAEVSFAEQERTRLLDIEKAKATQKDPTIVVNVLERAVTPRTPTKPSIFLNIGLAILCGTIFGLGAAFLSERLMPTFGSPSDIEHHLGIPVLASITRTRT